MRALRLQRDGLLSKFCADTTCALLVVDETHLKTGCPGNACDPCLDAVVEQVKSKPGVDDANDACSDGAHDASRGLWWVRLGSKSDADDAHDASHVAVVGWTRQQALC